MIMYSKNTIAASFFLIMGIYVVLGQNVKDFSVWGFPEYEDQVFKTSFLTESLRNNSTKDDFKGYFFASSRDWKDIENGFYDKDGVAIRRADSIHFPTLIIRTALTSYYKWEESKDPKALAMFKSQVHWLSENFYECDGKYGFWVFTNYSEAYKLKPGWTSAMSQGMGIGVCLMAYKVTNDERYLKIADMALKGFFVPVDNGGFKRLWNGGLWFEEYPTEEASLTLNGFIFGIAGLYNFYQNTGSPQTKELFDESVETLYNNLDSFRGTFTSYYSKKMPFHFAKDSYHKIHALQLAWLYEITQKPKFKSLSKHFLELHISDFKINKDLDFAKIRNIESNECINCEEYGPSNLIDDRWSWGKYWSAYKNPELVIDFVGKRKVKSVILYGVNPHSIMTGIVFVNGENGEVIHTIEKVSGIEDMSYFKTGKYETYIRKVSIPREITTSKLKLSFNGVSRKKVLALREIQCEISMDEEFEIIQNWIRAKEDL